MDYGEVLWLNGRLFWILSFCGLLVGLNLVFKSLNLVVVGHYLVGFELSFEAFNLVVVGHCLVGFELEF
jgi:hypothetical protein